MSRLGVSMGPVNPQVQRTDCPFEMTPEEFAAFEKHMDALDAERRRVDADEFDAMSERQAMEAEHAAALESQDAGEGEPW